MYICAHIVVLSVRHTHETEGGCSTRWRCTRTSVFLHIVALPSRNSKELKEKHVDWKIKMT